MRVGLTQGQLADLVGVTRAAVSQWEKDTVNVLGKNLVKIAAALGTSPDALMGENAPRADLDADRLSQVLELLESLPKHQNDSLSTRQRAKLIVYIYGADFETMAPGDVTALLRLVK